MAPVIPGLDQEDHSGAGEFVRTQDETAPGSGLRESPPARTVLLANGADRPAVRHQLRFLPGILTGHLKQRSGARHVSGVCRCPLWWSACSSTTRRRWRSPAVRTRSVAFGAALWGGAVDAADVRGGSVVWLVGEDLGRSGPARDGAGVCLVRSAEQEFCGRGVVSGSRGAGHRRGGRRRVGAGWYHQQARQQRGVGHRPRPGRGSAGERNWHHAKPPVRSEFEHRGVRVGDALLP